MIIVRYEVPT